jgi:predicted NBD/HSP70 family sugar kinase
MKVKIARSLSQDTVDLKEDRSPHHLRKPMINPDDLRQNLAQSIANVRSQRATSRRNLADVMRLSPTTAGFYVDHLIELGYLRESGLEQGLKGRPKRCLSTVAEAGWFAGIEFNAERVQGVRVDFSGRLAFGGMRPLPEDADTKMVMTEIKELIKMLNRRASGPLLGIGLGAPGVVDPKRGIGVYYTFVHDWREIPVQAELNKRFKVPVTLENNLRAIALAERWFGGAKELSDYLILGPRSGFGIAIVSDGKVLGGARNAAGEVGLWPWPGRSSHTQLHDHLSSPSVWRRLKGASSQTRLPADLRAALTVYEHSTSEAWHKVVLDYAQVLASLQLLLDTTTCFLHGPLNALGDRFCHAIGTAMVQMAPSLQNQPLALIPSKLGDDAGALGAASLAMEAWSPESS